MSRLTCREIILDHLDDYLDGTLDPKTVADFESHLGRCPSCVAYLNTYRRTREWVRRTGAALPERVQSRLREFLLARLSAG